MPWPVIVVFCIYALLISGIVAGSSLRNRKITAKLKEVATQLGWDNSRRMKMSPEIRALSSGMKCSLSARAYGKQHAVRTVEVALQTGLPGRFYIRNRTSPPIRRFPFSNIKYWKQPAEVPLDSAGRSPFAAGADNSGAILKLISSPAVRQLLQKNIIEGDGELQLEDGKLYVSGFTRARMQDEDPAITERVLQMVRQQWDLLRTVLATLDPSQIQVEERQALAIHCPYCKNELLEVSDLIRCSQCGTLHHAACWSENGRCSLFGCSGSPMPFIKEEGAKIST